MLKKNRPKGKFLPPKIALRVECSDLARNPYFPAYLSNVRFKCIVCLSATVEILNLYMGEAGGAQTRNSTDDQSELFTAL
jgi:hypothetical protein